jgi:hypothetical protein
MEMRGMAFDDLSRAMLRVMNGVRAALVGRPFARWLRTGIGILSAKLRPPFRFEPLLPFFSIRRTDGKTGNALVVFDDEGELRFEQGVRCGIDVTDQLAVLVEVGGVSTLMAGCKGDRIESFEVLRS